MISGSAGYSARIPVAPLAGAWIEITLFERQEEIFRVAPLAGAWIEIRETL